MSNLLSEVHPELVLEWSERNLPLTPDKITYGSNKIVWWIGTCGHECNVEESVMQRMDIERVRTALKMLAPEERAIIQDFFFTESPIPVKELVEKYAMPKTSIYRKRDDALKALKKILENA